MKAFPTIRIVERKNTMTDQSNDKQLDTTTWAPASRLALIILAAVLLMPLLASAQEVGAYAWANRPRVLAARQSDPAQADADKAKMSRRFSDAALQALSILRGMRTHMAYSLSNGLPVPKFWLAGDREFAADAVDQATVAASTAADDAALRELLQYHAALQSWVEDILVAQREMRLANYYMSASALQDDSQYQALLASEESLRVLLGSRRAPFQQELPEGNARASDTAKAEHR